MKYTYIDSFHVFFFLKSSHQLPEPRRATQEPHHPRHRHYFFSFLFSFVFTFLFISFFFVFSFRRMARAHGGWRHVAQGSIAPCRHVRLQVPLYFQRGWTMIWWWLTVIFFSCSKKERGISHSHKRSYLLKWWCAHSSRVLQVPDFSSPNFPSPSQRRKKENLATSKCH